jgi:pyruvate dehydrogenase E1 component alpha subunit
MARCPIKRASALAIERGACSPADLDAWRRRLQAEIDEAIAEAEASPFPDPADILANTY